MRTISYTTRFKRDYRREKAGLHGRRLDALLRDCHIRPDLVLIYRKPDEGTLELVRLGSHSELGL